MESVFSRCSPSLQRTLSYLYEQRSRPVIIVGNGPSLATIDYTRYPDNPLIVRLNNFFLEPYYYVGKYVDFVMCATHYKPRLLAYYITLQALIVQQDYIFADRACIATPYEIETYKDENPYYPIVDIHELFTTTPWSSAVHSALYVKEYLSLPHPTTGMSALIALTLLGYTSIYIAGIDFYAGKAMQSAYVYDMESKHNMRVQFRNDTTCYMNQDYNISQVHNREFDLACLEWCFERTGGRIRSLCPTSNVLNDIIPLANVKPYSVYFTRTKAEHTFQDYLYIPQNTSKSR